MIRYDNNSLSYYYPKTLQYQIKTNMSNKAKRNLFLTLLILEVVMYFCLAVFKTRYDLDVKWWIFSIAAIIFAFLLGAYRNFRQAVKEDEKYGPIK